MWYCEGVTDRGRGGVERGKRDTPPKPRPPRRIGRWRGGQRSPPEGAAEAAAGSGGSVPDSSPGGEGVNVTTFITTRVSVSSKLYQL